jgi:hypothetical protein
MGLKADDERLMVPARIRQTLLAGRTTLLNDQCDGPILRTFVSADPLLIH